MRLLTTMFLIGSIGLAGCGTNGATDASSKATKVFAYTSGQYTNNMSGFELDKTTGALSPTAQGTLASGQSLPMISAALNNKKFLLTVNYSSNSISTYAINGTTGELTLVAHTDLGVGTAPSWVVTHPSLPVAYVAQAGTDNISVLDVDSTTGAVTVRGQVAAGDGVTALEMNAAGTVMYSVDQNANEIGIYSVASIDGAITKAGSIATPGGSAPNHAKLHPSGNFLYVANWSGASMTSYAVSGTSLSLIETYSTGAGGAYMIAVSPDGGRVFVCKPYANEVVKLTVNPTTGVVSGNAAETVSGMVNMAFYGEFSFIVSWANAASQLPIQTRSYSTDAGLGGSALSQTADMRGIYQLVLVEIEQEE